MIRDQVRRLSVKCQVQGWTSCSLFYRENSLKQPELDSAKTRRPAERANQTESNWQKRKKQLLTLLVNWCIRIMCVSFGQIQFSSEVAIIQMYVRACDVRVKKKKNEPDKVSMMQHCQTQKDNHVRHLIHAQHLKQPCVDVIKRNVYKFTDRKRASNKTGEKNREIISRTPTSPPSHILCGTCRPAASYPVSELCGRFCTASRSSGAGSGWAPAGKTPT